MVKLISVCVRSCLYRVLIPYRKAYYNNFKDKYFTMQKYIVAVVLLLVVLVWVATTAATDIP